MNKKRTIVYIDGSNLYYGLLRDSTDKWLDLMLFVKSLLRDDHEIAMIKYFASRVIDKSSDHHRSARQDKYSTLYRKLEIGSTAGCRLPESLATADGRRIHCPEAWRA